MSISSCVGKVLANCVFQGIGPFHLVYQTWGHSPDRWGSAGWASSCKANGRQLDSQSGSIPGFQVQSPGSLRTLGDNDVSVRRSLTVTCTALWDCPQKGRLSMRGTRDSKLMFLSSFSLPSHLSRSK